MIFSEPTDAPTVAYDRARWRAQTLMEGAMAATKQKDKSKGEQEKDLSKELEMTFPASDPPASTQPGSGITGPNVRPPDPAPKPGK